MALTDLKIKNASITKEDLKKDGSQMTQKKLSDGRGLYLLVNKRGGKYWRYDYKIGGKRKTLSIGTYPDISLKEARELITEAKKLIVTGVDPSSLKQDIRKNNIKKTNERKEKAIADKNTFGVVTIKWHNKEKNKWSERHAVTILNRLNDHVIPFIGNIPVKELTKIEVSNVLTPIAERGTTEIAHRIAGYIRNILEYACDFGLIEFVKMGKTSNILPMHISKPMKAITDPDRIGDFMRAVHGYKGAYVTCIALKIFPLVSARTGEFRMARWIEIDFKKSLWTIPANHRKLKHEQKQNALNVHLVPLAKQVIQLLDELKNLTGKGDHVFPSARGDSRCMSENTINDAIKNMGFGDELVGHGVRTMFSSMLNESGFNPDAIERQLAHSEKDAVRAAYNRSEYLEERTLMMQKWADYLDFLRLNK